jgi:hypothetical protein
LRVTAQFIELGRTDEARCQQLLIAFELRGRQAQIGFGLRELRTH